MEKYINFNTQKINLVKFFFEKDFYKLLNIAFYGETMGNVQNSLQLNFIKKDDENRMIKQQSKLTFNGLHKSHTIYDCYTAIHSSKTKF